MLSQHVLTLYVFHGTTIKHAVIVETRICLNSGYHGKWIGRLPSCATKRTKIWYSWSELSRKNTQQEGQSLTELQLLFPVLCTSSQWLEHLFEQFLILSNNLPRQWFRKSSVFLHMHQNPHLTNFTRIVFYFSQIWGGNLAIYMLFETSSLPIRHVKQIFLLYVFFRLP